MYIKIYEDLRNVGCKKASNQNDKFQLLYRVSLNCKFIEIEPTRKGVYIDSLTVFNYSQIIIAKLTCYVKKIFSIFPIKNVDII